MAVWVPHPSGRSEAKPDGWGHDDRLAGGVPDEFRLLAFLDYGVAYRHDELPGEDNHVTMGSFGPGLRYTMARSLEVRVDYAIPWHEPDETGDRDRRWHLGVIFSF